MLYRIKTRHRLPRMYSFGSRCFYFSNKKDLIGSEVSIYIAPTEAAAFAGVIAGTQNHAL